MLTLARTAAAGGAPQASDSGFVLADAGLQTPESVLYDSEADVYLVSNINGSPDAHDGNGFISRLSPEGELIALKWIDGKSAGIALNAPKGSVLCGDSFYVADIDTVRVFSRRSGKPRGSIGIPSAKFLNDITATPGGVLYVSDTALGTVFRISPAGQVDVFIEGGAVKQANGVTLEADTLWVARMDSPKVSKLDLQGHLLSEVTLPAAGLDGIVRLANGNLLVSSWAGAAVYEIAPSERVTTLFTALVSPADIGFDSKRGVVLIPLFTRNIVEARPLGR